MGPKSYEKVENKSPKRQKYARHFPLAIMKNMNILFT